MSERGRFLRPVLGLRKSGSVANIADGDSAASRDISAALLEELGLDGNRGAPEAQRAGAVMEHIVAEHLGVRLPVLAPDADWTVGIGGRISAFAQYDHIDTLQSLIDSDPSRVLAMAVGREYEVKPDVVVGRMPPTLPKQDALAPAFTRPVLHASVSCKLTIRSDRVQNIRQESAVLLRQRKGRAPHIVAVTLEPLPTRLAAIAQGTGDVDAVYHLALDELLIAVRGAANLRQQTTLDELIGQNRLLDFRFLAPTLAHL